MAARRGLLSPWMTKSNATFQMRGQIRKRGCVAECGRNIKAQQRGTLHFRRIRILESPAIYAPSNIGSPRRKRSRSKEPARPFVAGAASVFCHVDGAWRKARLEAHDIGSGREAAPLVVRAHVQVGLVENRVHRGARGARDCVA